MVAKCAEPSVDGCATCEDFFDVVLLPKQHGVPGQEILQIFLSRLLTMEADHVGWDLRSGEVVPHAQ